MTFSGTTRSKAHTSPRKLLVLPYRCHISLTICVEHSLPGWGPPMADYYSVIARAVSRLPCNTGEARHVIYEQARTALREALSNNDPPFSEAELAVEPQQVVLG
jgi:hypothetical protein